MPASMKDIAKEANVSVATVSRILVGRGDVHSRKTRDAVVDAAQRLRYRTNLLVSGIQTGRTKTVGVLVPTFDPFPGQIVAGIHDTLTENDYLPLVAWGDHSERRRSGCTEFEQIQRLVQRRVDGVIILPVEDAVTQEYFHEVVEQKLPLVVVVREMPNVQTDFVGTDDEAGGRAAAEHLLGLGHRRLAYVVNIDTYRHSADNLRWQGFEQAIKACPGARCASIGVPMGDEGIEPVYDMLCAPSRPTAVFAVNDQFAAIVYKAAEKTGIRIPTDLSVVGFANSPFGGFMSPALTTFEQSPRQIGEMATRRILQRILEPEKLEYPSHIRLPPKLITRGSCSLPKD